MFHDFLITCLSRRHFVSHNSNGKAGVSEERHLSTISDAFCTAYAENDCLSLQLCIDFLKDISKDLIGQQDKLRENVMQIIKQVFCAADFAEGNSNFRSTFFHAHVKLPS